MENKIYGRIYKITNIINGKSYIGQTISTINHRFSQHVYDSKNKKNSYMVIIRAIKKYGKENFKIEELAIAYNQKQLNFSEGFFINNFNTLVPNGYNVTNIIDGCGKRSKKTINKIKTKANTPERLQIASQNGIKTRGKKLKGSSIYVGVSKCKQIYLSNIRFNNTLIILGRYNLESDAAKVYDIAAIKCFGNDCILNFPELREKYINNEISIKNTTGKINKNLYNLIHHV